MLVGFGGVGDVVVVLVVGRKGKYLFTRGTS